MSFAHPARPPDGLGRVIYRRRVRAATMSDHGGPERWEAELRALREELARLRAEQREMAGAIQELVSTFRTVATHLGIAAEPYVRKGEPARDRDVPGFA